jgi:stage V sporulation protein K
VGLNPVKDYLYQLVNRLKVDQLFRQQGFTGISELPLQHLIFTGNPGTGKTTVARLIGQIYRSLGLLSKGHCIEVNRADLVAGYVGQTALKTRNVIKKALEGVLFIDEAYTLNRGGVNDFGLEAIDMLVKTMDEYSGKLLIIIAGYPIEIEQFLKSNPGLTSRFAPPIQFPDYSVDDLSLIFQKLADQEGYGYSPDLLQELKSKFNQMKWQDEINFGNARAAKEIFNEMKGRLANRLVKHQIKESNIDIKEMRQFYFEDLPQYGYRVNLTQKSDEKAISAGTINEIFYKSAVDPKKGKDSKGISYQRRRYYMPRKPYRATVSTESAETDKDHLAPLIRESKQGSQDKS